MSAPILPKAPQAYAVHDENQTRDLIQRAFGTAVFKGDDIRMGTPPNAPSRLILKDNVTGTNYSITIVSGTLTLTAVT